VIKVPTDLCLPLFTLSYSTPTLLLLLLYSYSSPTLLLLYLGLYGVVYDAGDLSAPVLIGAVAQYISFDTAALVTATVGAVGSVWYILMVPETLGRNKSGEAAVVAQRSRKEAGGEASMLQPAAGKHAL
jgi:hypothetical protein